jgi:hypothetical protein
MMGCCLCLLLSGCNLGNGDPAAFTQTPAPTKTLAADSFTTAQPETMSLSATPTDQTPPLPNTPPAASPTLDRVCTPRADWDEYEIQRGDNLTRIATITGSTVDELIAANCLENPNTIRSGQRLYVPRAPHTPTPPPSATPR